MNFTNRLESDLVLISQFHLAQNAGHLEIPLTEKDWFCQIENLEQIDLPSRHSKKKKNHTVMWGLIIQAGKLTARHSWEVGHSFIPAHSKMTPLPPLLFHLPPQYIHMHSLICHLPGKF